MKSQSNQNHVIDFNAQERQFIDSVICGYHSNNYELKIDILERIIEKRLGTLSTLTHFPFPQSTRTFLEGIRFKIYEWKADREIEKMLTDQDHYSKANTHTGVSTRLESYRKTIPNIGPLHGKVLDSLKDGPLSRRQIADSTGISLQSVCARVSELMDAGLIERSGTMLDPKTDRRVEVLKAVSLL